MNPLTAETVEGVLGPVDGALALDLVRTGATEDELRRAHAWITDGALLVDGQRSFPSGRVLELVEILSSDDVDVGDDF